MKTRYQRLKITNLVLNCFASAVFHSKISVAFAKRDRYKRFDFRLVLCFGCSFSELRFSAIFNLRALSLSRRNNVLVAFHSEGNFRKFRA